jgi:glycosyltransferase involved in cell wall biosynthesis
MPVVERFLDSRRSGCAAAAATSTPIVTSDSRARVGFVGTYPPDACGIATFTASLRDAIASQAPGTTTGVIRLGERADTTCAPPEVVATWHPNDRVSLQAAIDAAGAFDHIVLQHEFGIFGGPDGDEVVRFAERCPVPLVTVFHTVLPEPSPHQREIIESLVALSAVSVVQTESARARLLEVHAVDGSSVIVIPHGAVLNLEGPTIEVCDRAPTVLTWGLVGPGKGIEHGIRAMARLGAVANPPTYLVAGRTHPNVLAREGESYRSSLRALACELGVADRVVFDATYRDFPALRELVRSVDVVLLPYDSRDQATSGVLVEAIAAGKPIVATAFPHAVEALGDGAGIVVPHEDPAAMADAIDQILASPATQRQMRARSSEAARRLAWPAVGELYLRAIGRSADALVVA